MKTQNMLIGSCLLFTLASTPFLTGCMLQMSESVADPGLGLNGGFEHVKKDLPVNWLVYTPKTTGEGDFDLSYDRSDFKEGQQSLKYTVRNCSSKGGRFSPGIAQEIPVKPGEEYLVSFWIKNKGADYSVNISAVNAVHMSKGPQLRSSANTDEWQHISYHYTIPEEMERMRIEVNVLAAGTFWIDDVKVEKEKSSF